MESSDRKVRLSGGVLTVCGLFLSSISTWLIFWLGDVIARSGSDHRWKGGVEFTSATFHLFYAILLFGVVALAAGLFQLRTGRRGKGALVALLLAFAAIAYPLWKILSLDSAL